MRNPIKNRGIRVFLKQGFCFIEQILYLNGALKECSYAFFNFILDMFNGEKNSSNSNYPLGIKSLNVTDSKLH